ncbi:MAG: hypothetical protein IIA41_10850 [SAR324 cluster bacterium]|nr:hypothetical protein [SAR324 cluster bacterium]
MERPAKRKLAAILAAEVVGDSWLERAAGIRKRIDVGSSDIYSRIHSR